jgi:hypothetical protein
LTRARHSSPEVAVEADIPIQSGLISRFKTPFCAGKFVNQRKAMRLAANAAIPAIPAEETIHAARDSDSTCHAGEPLSELEWATRRSVDALGAILRDHDTLARLHARSFVERDHVGLDHEHHSLREGEIGKRIILAGR